MSGEPAPRLVLREAADFGAAAMEFVASGGGREPVFLIDEARAARIIADLGAFLARRADTRARAAALARPRPPGSGYPGE